MNNVILIGRLTSEPEIRYVKGQNGDFATASYTLAVNRDYKNANGDYDADFIRCSCTQARAEFAGKYLHKGMKMAVTGSIRTRTYEKENGEKTYFTEVAVNSHEFVERKQDRTQTTGNGSDAQAQPKAENNGQQTGGYSSLQDDDIPF